MECEALWVIWTFVWTISKAELLHAVTSETELFCVFNQSCILPCSFQNTSEDVIHWTHLTAEESPVHSHYDGKDQLGVQDQNYRDRTSLFRDQISRGNASLLLRGVKVQDEGRYRCFISTSEMRQERFISLKIYAPVSEVHITQVKNRVTCSSEGIYPEPELTWSTIPPSNILLRSTTTVQPTEQQLYSISSSLVVSDTDLDLIYSCTVTILTNTRTATSMERIEKGTGGAVGLVVAVILVAALMGVLPCLCEKFSKHFKDTKRCWCLHQPKKVEEPQQLRVLCEEQNLEAEEINTQRDEEEGDACLGTDKITNQQESNDV